MTRELHVPRDVQRWIGRRLREGDTEPIAHILLREAFDERRENPRSSLIIAVAALEVGLKQCIAELVPGARWLVENVPTPPVATILKDYLPLLTSGVTIADKPVKIRQSVLDVVKKGVFLRNDLAHRGSATIRNDTLDEILKGVRELLYLFDAYRGHEWSLSLAFGAIDLTGEVESSRDGNASRRDR